MSSSYYADEIARFIQNREALDDYRGWVEQNMPPDFQMYIRGLLKEAAEKGFDAADEV